MPFIQPHNRIYYYCSLATALEFILPKFELLLSPIENTNDPRENKSFYFKHRNNIYTSPIDNDLIKLNREISETIREGCKVLCFCQDTDVYWGSLLSKMWAHYGGNHKGVCLEIDKTEFINENKTAYDFDLFRPISYFKYNPNKHPEYKLIDHTTIKNGDREKYLKEIFRKEHLNFLFFTKNIEWESETEIRLLHFSNNFNNEYCSIRNSLKNIHLGINFHSSYIPAIQNLIEGINIDIKVLEYGDVGLMFKNLGD
ncbi:MAG: DUF2971 domain-containing protein [Sphingobacteriia bacterium]|nr:DUF2971 domain-containing protein [Sphingobacteriia bacterium]